MKPFFYSTPHPKRLKQVFLILLTVSQFACASIGEKSIKVYITKTGTHYHTRECIHLGRSKIPTTLTDATNKGYTPCKNCRAQTLIQYQSQ